ncbi:MAG: hypothetical protein HFG51_09070 [Lachnospiraceae bacterium]|nr:hypothetical protein [Lachnospiraceae bacterium]
MKRKYLILAAVCLVLGSTACSSKNTEPTAQETTAETAAEESREQEESTEADKESKKETKKEEEKKEETTEETTAKIEKEAVTGRVVKVEKNIVTISGQDDLEYQFDLKDAETKSDLELGEGDEIQVVFLNDEEEKIKKAESYQILTSLAMVGDMDPVISGVIQSVDGSQVTIEAGSGKSYRFSTAIARIVAGDKGMAVGEYVEITYMGNLKDEKALRVVTEEASGDADATYYALTGNLVQASDASVTIAAADGTSFSFTLGENVFASDFEGGEELEVIYEGSLTNHNAVAIAVDYP